METTEHGALHLVGGFLGAGKSTAIVAAARLLSGRGRRVGIVTNDQGKYLVDTGFAAASSVPTVEVTGGCFCCNYGDFRDVLDRLEERSRPEVVFAESVGSCADLVATVIKPFLELEDAGIAVRSFSVFADARLLSRWVRGLPLPFSGNVTYLYGKQLEEAGLIVINKSDLLTPADGEGLLALTARRFPDKQLRLQSSLTEAEITRWLDALEAQAGSMPLHSLDIDYGTYGAGEADLAWYDAALRLRFPRGHGGDAARAAVEAVRKAVLDAGVPVGHVKFLLQHADGDVKVSMTAEDDGRMEGIPRIRGEQADLTVNARVQAPAPALRALMHAALEEGAHGADAGIEFLQEDCFHPGFPRPTHRLG